MSAAPAGPVLRLAQALQAVHQDGVVGDGIRGVDEATEQLVVACRRQRQLHPHRFLLRAGVRGPSRLEVEDRAIEVGEGHMPTVTGVARRSREQAGGSSG